MRHMRDRARPAVSNRRRIRVAAAAGVAALMAVLGACADDADRRPAASGSASPDTASPQQPASPPTETSAIVPTAPPTPTTSPADAEILNLLATLDVAPQTAKGGLDEAAAAKRLAEPMLSLVKASWRVVRPEWRLDGNLGTLADPRIWRPATSPGADTWVGVSGFLGTGGHDALFLFRSTPADPTWKLAFVSFLQDAIPFPAIAQDAVGAAGTVTSAAGLAADPAAVCRALVGDGKGTGPTIAWGSRRGQAEAQRVEKATDAAGYTRDFTTTTRTDAVGPVWRTADGGALVPCVHENRWSMTVPAGHPALTQNGTSHYVTDIAGLRVTGFSETTLAMELIAVPPASSRTSTDIVATALYPLDYRNIRAG